MSILSHPRHRRSTLDSKRKSHSGLVRNVIHEHIIQRNVIHGSVIDFLIRLCPTSINNCADKDEHVSNYAPQALDKAAEMVDHEMLYSGILEILTMFWKALGGWVNEPNLLKKRIREVWRNKHQAMCIRSEVEIWIFRRSVLEASDSRPVESHKERCDRHQDFWAQFHEIPRAFDSKTPACDKSKDECLDATSDLQKKMCLNSNWKTRPSRSRCSAGVREWSKPTLKTSCQDLDRPATTGGLRQGRSNFERTKNLHCLNARAESAAKRNHKWLQENCPEVVSATGRNPTSLGRKRSLSLPNLTITSGAFANTSVKKEPPPATTFAYPSRGKPVRSQSKCDEVTTAKRYLSAVQAVGVLPKPIPFCTGHSMKFTACGQVLSDKDLIAVVNMMPAMQVEEIDLRDNIGLSEKPMLKLFETLVPTARFLQQLNLNRCINAGQKVLDIIIAMLANLQDGCRHLKALDLSGVPIGARRHMPLAKAIASHPELTTLEMADTDLGGSLQPVQCVDELLHSKSIHTLDLGWNCFSEDTFVALGKGLVDTQRLKSLSLVNCSSIGQVGHASPIVFFIEQLNRTNTLTKLDVALNRIDFRAALVLEDALENQKGLTELNVSQNALGYLGMRSMLRLLSRSTSGLQHFYCNGCTIGEASDQHESYQVFSFTNPGGRYTLELDRPYHRSILRMLYKTCSRLNLSPDVAFSGINASLRYSHALEGDDGVWMVPTTGTLSATFSIDTAVDRIFKDIDPWNFSMFIDEYISFTRVQPSFNKVAPLLAQWKCFDGRVMEQRTFLRALSADFSLPYPFIEEMCQNRLIIAETLGQLIPCMQGGQVTRFMAMLLSPFLGDCVTILNTQKTLLSLNVENPNAHYEFNLENAGDFHAAERLLLLDRWETVIARRLRRPDTSQNGNRSQIRNAKFHQRPLAVSSIQEWNMPEYEHLEFDYSSGKRPPPDAPVLDDLTFSKMLVILQKSSCDVKAQLRALQMLSHMIYLKSVQMRSLLGIFVEEAARVDLFVMFFLRVVDFYNEKVYRVRFEHQEELDLLYSRLGVVTCFPFIQPEQTRFSWDLSVYEQRLAANILVSLGAQEGAQQTNLREVHFINEMGVVDKLTAGIPRSWEKFETMPPGGKLRISYVCSPEDRKYKIRRKLYEMYGYRAGVPEDKVEWWAGLNEAPEDVLEYLSFLVARPGFKSLAAVFEEIDGVGGNGVINLREFEEGYSKMKCQKFKGAGELQRVHGLFHYLDPSGEGQISIEEWNVLDLLWKEIKWSITEFIQFCDRTFGGLDEAWANMDADQGGEIDEKEWIEACRHFGYFGPVKPIFDFLDADDEGTISKEEFEDLEQFRNAV